MKVLLLIAVGIVVKVVYDLHQPNRDEYGMINECIGCKGNCNDCPYKKLVDKERNNWE